MISVTIIYPNSEDTTFDIDYYCNKHVPMVVELLGDALKGCSVDSGLAGGAPGQTAPYVAIGRLQFESIESFQQSFGPVAAQLSEDLPNYTNSQPQLQISEIKL